MEHEAPKRIKSIILSDLSRFVVSAKLRTSLQKASKTNTRTEFAPNTVGRISSFSYCFLNHVAI